MSNILPFSDPGGNTSQEDKNKEDIKNLMSAFNEFVGSGNAQLRRTDTAEIANDGTKDRVILGYQQGLKQWGLFVSKPGVDVNFANADQLVFNSNQNVFKIAKTDVLNAVTTTFNIPDAAVGAFNSGQFLVASVAHGLSFVPTAIVYIDTGSGGYNSLPVLSLIATGSNSGKWLNYFFEADVTNLKIYLNVMQTGVTGGTVNLTGVKFKYYLLQESAT